LRFFVAFWLQQDHWIWSTDVMFLKRLERRKNGKAHTYWALVESYRTAGSSRHHIVAYLRRTQEERNRTRLGGFEWRLDKKVRPPNRCLIRLVTMSERWRFVRPGQPDLDDGRRSMVSELQFLRERKASSTVGTPKAMLRHFEEPLFSRIGGVQAGVEVWVGPGSDGAPRP
jgi:hypothetical protein